MGHCSRRRSVTFLFSSTKRRDEAPYNESPLYQKVDLLLHIHGTSLLFIGSINFYSSLPDICLFRPAIDLEQRAHRMDQSSSLLCRFIFPSMRVMAQRAVAVHQAWYQRCIRIPSAAVPRSATRLSGRMDLHLTIFFLGSIRKNSCKSASPNNGSVCPPGVLVGHHLAPAKAVMVAEMT